MARYGQKNTLKKRILACLGTAFLAASLFGCGETTETPRIAVEDSDNSVSYNLIQVTKDTVTKTESLRCTYKKMGEEEIHFPDSGKYVDKVLVQKGDSVKAGDCLVELSTGTLEKEIEQLQYQISRNELQLGYLNEQESLDRQNTWINYIYYTGGSDTDKKNLEKNLENQEYNYETQRQDYEDSLEFDRRKLQNLKSELANSRVYASMDGVVYSIKDNLEGSTSNMEDVIMVIVDNSEGYFEVSAPEYVPYFKENEPVKLSIVYGSGHGEYQVVPMDMSEWGDTQKFSILSGAEAGSIEAGTTATMTVVTGEAEDVLSVPTGCVYQADGAYYVYVLDDNGMREVCWVEIGLYGDAKVEIRKGLNEGDTVIKR